MIESTISARMDEIASIAYSISQDKSFYLEPVDGVKASGYELSNTLSRYLAGNGFIEYLAYYRLSEPDKIYTSRGELPFSDFWHTYLGLDQQAADGFTNDICSTTRVRVDPISFGDGGPQFSTSSQAFVLMLIPRSEVGQLLESQLTNCYGALAVFDGEEREIYRLSTMKAELQSDLTPSAEIQGESYVTLDGRRTSGRSKLPTSTVGPTSP